MVVKFGFYIFEYKNFEKKFLNINFQHFDCEFYRFYQNLGIKLVISAILY